MDIVLFTIASKKIKYLGINLTKEIKDLYTESVKTQKKKIKTLENRHTLCSLAGMINIVKISIPPESIYRFQVIPVKFPISFFVNFIWNHKLFHIGKTILRGNER